MAYSTQDQVQVAVGGSAKLAELTDLENGAAIDPAVVNAAIDEADGEIDGYIGHRYAVPLATVPPTVAALSARWAARVLRRNKYNGTELTDDLTREETDRKWLTAVGLGTISLGIEPTPAKASIVIDKASTRDSTKLVSFERLKGMW